MRTTVKIDNAAQHDVLAETGQKIVAADESLRKSFAGLDVEAVIPEVERSLAEIGIDVPDTEVRDYAQHIADREDYEFVLQ